MTVSQWASTVALFQLHSLHIEVTKPKTAPDGVSSLWNPRCGCADWKCRVSPVIHCECDSPFPASRPSEKLCLTTAPFLVYWEEHCDINFPSQHPRMMKDMPGSLLSTSICFSLQLNNSSFPFSFQYVWRTRVLVSGLQLQTLQK